MNRRKLLAAAAIALSAGSGFNAVAADVDGPKTRAQVLAELEQARADGSFYAAGDGTPRGLARARLAEQQEKARRARDSASGRDGQAAAAQQRAGS